MIKELLKKVKEKIKKWLSCDCNRNITVINKLDLENYLSNFKGQEMIINSIKLNRAVMKALISKNI